MECILLWCFKFLWVNIPNNIAIKCSQYLPLAPINLQWSRVPLYLPKGEPWQVIRRRQGNKNEVFIGSLPGRLPWASYAPQLESWLLTCGQLNQNLLLSLSICFFACPFKPRGKLPALNYCTKLYSCPQVHLQKTLLNCIFKCATCFQLKPWLIK